MRRAYGKVWGIGVIGAAVMVLCTGCVGGGADSPTVEPVQQEGDATVVRIDADDRMQYSVTSFTVTEGERVRVVLRHTGRMPVTSMGHNVVVLRAGEDVAGFARAVLAQGGSGANGYLPDVLQPRVLVHTAMIGGGEADSVDFVAPAPGTYEYLCTFPGHFGMMKGRMRVLAQ